MTLLSASFGPTRFQRGFGGWNLESRPRYLFRRSSNLIPQSVLDAQSIEARELPVVIRYQCAVKRYCLGRDEKIVASDRIAGQLELRADRSVDLVGWCIQGKGIDGVEETASTCALNRGDAFFVAP